MIYTRYGTPCEILEVICGTRVRVRFLAPGSEGTRLLALPDLRADGGQREIDAALTRCADAGGDA